MTQLLVAAGIVLATNIVTFGLLYWQLDSGGPSGRLVHAACYPDFQFPQTMSGKAKNSRSQKRAKGIMRAM